MNPREAIKRIFERKKSDPRTEQIRQTTEDLQRKIDELLSDKNYLLVVLNRHESEMIMPMVEDIQTTRVSLVKVPDQLGFTCSLLRGESESTFSLLGGSAFFSSLISTSDPDQPGEINVRSIMHVQPNADPNAQRLHTLGIGHKIADVLTAVYQQSPERFAR